MMVRHAAVVLCVGASVLLSACSGPSYEAATDGSDKTKDNSASDPSNSAPPTSKDKGPAPVMPKAAKSHLDEGAGAFVKHYIALRNYASASGNRSPFDDLAEDDCKACKDLIPPPPIRLEGGEWKAGTPSYKVEKDPYTATVYMPVESGAARVFNGTDAKPRKVEGRKWTMAVTVTWKGKAKAWRVSAVDES